MQQSMVAPDVIQKNEWEKEISNRLSFLKSLWDSEAIPPDGIFKGEALKLPDKKRVSLPQ